MAGHEPDSKVFKAHLFRRGTLKSLKDKISFVLENSTGEEISITKINSLSFGGRFVNPDNFVFLGLDKKVWKPSAISSQSPLVLSQNVPLQIIVRDLMLPAGMINVRLSFMARMMGEVIVDINEQYSG
ncbi:hypothetical protein JXQ70_03020 [bacterium]|nr:hypothetical protein [bacterium]